MIRPTHRMLWTALLTGLTLVGGVFAPSARAQAPGQQKIQFSSPNAPVTSTNGSQTSVRDSMGKQAQDLLLKNIPIGHSLGPLDINPNAPMPVVTMRPAPDKKTLEMMDRQRNWAFNDGLDLATKVPTLEEAAGIWQFGPDGRDKRSQTSIERYLENSAPKRSVDPVPYADTLAAERRGDFSGTNGYGADRYRVEQVDNLRDKLFGSGQPTGLAVTAPGATIRGGLPSSFLPPGFDQSALNHQSEFQKMLDPKWMPPGVTSAGSLVGGGVDGNAANSLQPNPLAGFRTPGAEERTVSAASQNFNSVTSFRSHVLDDVNARALGLPDPSTLAPAYVAPVLPAAPILPSTAFPKRRF